MFMKYAAKVKTQQYQEGMSVEQTFYYIKMNVTIQSVGSFGEHVKLAEAFLTRMGLI